MMAHPVRRNIAHLSASERQAYIDAVLQADLHAFSDGVSYWDKQDQIHQVTHKGPWGAALLVTGTPLALGVRLVCVVGSEPSPRPSFSGGARSLGGRA
ncbi:hypothetical protein GCM10022275_31320 [Tessaracoccus defluvii]